MLAVDPCSEGGGGHIAGGLAGQAQGIRDRSAEQGVAKRGENERQRGFGNQVVLMLDPQLVDQPADCLEDFIFSPTRALP